MKSYNIYEVVLNDDDKYCRITYRIEHNKTFEI